MSLYSYLQVQLGEIAELDLPREERYKVIRSYLPELIEDNYSRNRIVKLFRDNGIPVDRTRLNRMYDDIKFGNYVGTRMIMLPKDEIIGHSYMDDNTHNSKTKYLYKMDYAAMDFETGDLSRNSWGLFSDEQLSKDEAIQRMLDKMSEFDSPPRDNIFGMTISNVYVRPNDRGL